MESSSLITNELTEELAAQVIRHRLEGLGIADVMPVIAKHLPNEGWSALTASQQMMVEIEVLKAARRAAALDYWAVQMGLEGLEPSSDAVNVEAVFDEGTQDERELTLVRVHVAFHPVMEADKRRGFILELGSLIKEETR